MTIDWDDLDDTVLEFAVQLEVPEFSSYRPRTGEGPRDNIELPGGQKVSGLGRFLMYRLAYREFEGYASMLTTRSVVRQGNDTPFGVRWFEVRRNTGTGDYEVFQASTYSPNDGINRWMGSIAQDQVGNIAIGYSVARAGNDPVYPGIRYAGRLVDDPMRPNDSWRGDTH